MTRFRMVMLMSALAIAPGAVSHEPLQPAPQRGKLAAFTSDSEFVQWLRGVDALRAARSTSSVCRSSVTISESSPRPRPTSLRGDAAITGRVTDGVGNARRSIEVAVPSFGVYARTDSLGNYLIRVHPSRLTKPETLAVVAQPDSDFRQDRLLEIHPGDSIGMDFRLCWTGSLRQRMSSMYGSQAANGSFTVSNSLSAVTDESITNVQHAGVDEGGIVKRHGDHLVILRRGRLFTVHASATALRPIAAVNAFAPNIKPSGDWYDEMLVSGDRVVVIGYSYRRGGTEIGVFRIDADGRLAHEDTYHIRSNDYYSSRNYASRLIGDRLILYTPIHFWNADAAMAALPALRRWSKDTAARGFERIATARQIFRPARPVDGDARLVMHALTTCKLTGEVTCESRVVVGPPSRVYYASPTALYVWVTERSEPKSDSLAEATVYRLPMEGEAPTALRVTGTPVDQFSFLEKDGTLNVVVRDKARGELMWGSEFSDGQTWLLRAPLTDFGDGTRRPGYNNYRGLPVESGRVFHNRFVGDHLLYGNGSGWGSMRIDGGLLYVTRLGGSSTRRIALEHGIDRVEVMGKEALVVGSDGSALHFSGIALGTGARPAALSKHHQLAGVSQGEVRSHGFFYRAENDSAGVIGIPVSGDGEVRAGYEHLFRGSASIAFLRNGRAGFTPVGKPSASVEGGEDACQASCVDWYGNSRPIFLGGRMYALLGYDLVEGVERDGKVVETRRVNFAARSGR